MNHLFSCFNPFIDWSNSFWTPLERACLSPWVPSEIEEDLVKVTCPNGTIQERQRSGEKIDDAFLKKCLPYISGKSIFLDHAIISSEGLKSVLTWMPDLKVVSLAGCYSLSEGDIIEFIHSVPLLEDIDLSLLDLSEKVVFALESSCPKLMRIRHDKVSLSMGVSVRTTARAVRAFFRFGTAINESSELVDRLKKPSLFTPKAIIAISKMPSIKELIIAFHVELNYSELRPLAGRVAVIQGCNTGWDDRMDEWAEKGTNVRSDW